MYFWFPTVQVSDTAILSGIRITQAKKQINQQLPQLLYIINVFGGEPETVYGISELNNDNK